MIRMLCALAALWLGLAAYAAAAQPKPDLDRLAWDVRQAEAVRAVKTLQRTYAQLGQFGLWRDMAGLFAAGGTYTFDDRTVTGSQAIAGELRARYGAGSDGLPPGAVHTFMIETPLITVAADGRTAKGRWHILVFTGSGGRAAIEGGILENDYVLEGGAWKIAAFHEYPQYFGPYETGWTNWKGADLPIVPYHFTPATAGVPVEPLASPPASKAALAALQPRIAALNAEDQVRNLQSAYGYYLDRKMWDDIADLFASDGVLEIAGVGVYRGPAGVRRALQRMGPAGLVHGELNDHPQFDTVVAVSPGAAEAWDRGIELGMLARADEGKAFWQASVFRNRFVKQGGVWKIREMRLFPLFKADYHQGWGRSRIVDPPPAPDQAPDLAEPSREGVMPAFLPGQASAVAPAGLRLAAAEPLTGRIAPAKQPVWSLGETNVRLARSTAYDGVENVSTAYGDLLDDLKSDDFASLFAAHGFKVSAFAGYYVGPDRIAEAGRRVWGKPPVMRSGISYHWRIQPVILIAADGRSATVQQRLFQPRTSKTPGKPGALLNPGFHAGMYHDQYVLEGGAWKMWNLSLDEPYVISPDWKGGWAAAKEPTSKTRPPPSPLMASNFLPDVPYGALGVREEHFRGGTGETIEWPGILPMWFDYRNPVSGREPEHYWPDCVPCVAAPQLKMTNFGYLQPPSGPEPAS